MIPDVPHVCYSVLYNYWQLFGHVDCDRGREGSGFSERAQVAEGESQHDRLIQLYGSGLVRAIRWRVLPAFGKFSTELCYNSILFPKGIARLPEADHLPSLIFFKACSTFQSCWRQQGCLLDLQATSRECCCVLKPEAQEKLCKIWWPSSDEKAYLTVIFALPMSPLVENLMPSFVTEIATVSPMPPRSLR